MTSAYDLNYNQTLSFLTTMWYNSLNDQVSNLGYTISLIMLFQSHKVIKDLEALCQLLEIVGPSGDDSSFPSPHVH